MSLSRLYCRPLAPGQVELSQEESHHAIRVLRLSAGDRVELFDGEGRWARAAIESADPKRTRLSADETQTAAPEPGPRLTIAVAPGKSHRQSIIIAKCTELGAARIQFMRCERSVAKPATGAMEKLRRRAIEACKQCGRRFLPDIPDVVPFDEVVRSAERFSSAAIAHPYGDTTAWTEIVQSAVMEAELLLLIGPEGGFTDQECMQAANAGIRAASLALPILRTETAALAACAVVSAHAVARGDAHR